jgi:hypothetical protein
VNRFVATAFLILGLAIVLSGVGGIAVGGDSAAAGWWLVIVGALIVTFGMVGLFRRGTT